MLEGGSYREQRKDDFTSTMKLPQNLQFTNVLPYARRNYFVLEFFPEVLLKVKSNCYWNTWSCFSSDWENNFHHRIYTPWKTWKSTSKTVHWFISFLDMDVKETQDIIIIIRSAKLYQSNTFPFSLQHQSRQETVLISF